MFLAVSSPAPGRVELVALDAEGDATSRERFAETEFAVRAREHERDHPRWVWADTTRWYPGLLAAGVRVERCVDLRMCRLLLRNAAAARDTELARTPRDRWDEPSPLAAASDALFELEAPLPDDDPVAELYRQRAAIAASAEPGRLGLLCAADSVGALVAVELRHAGLPWDAARHDRILTELLGERMAGGRPARMEALVAEIRAALDDPEVNPDSAPTLLRSLQRAGLRVGSTSRWELKSVEHPVVAPLLAYKRLARLYTANGWAWLAEWVREGRFRPVYVPAGVVTGRWASDGGGALQLPRQVRGAVVADPGWKLVVADAAQLEPRVLAAMSSDAAMARAGRAHDLYQGMVDTGAVETREQAKYGMLGAIYGGTTGESGRMRPRIERAFPRAMAFVEAAARAGERGETVSTWLGRTSPRGPEAGYDETRTAEDRDRDRTGRRAWGRFTRNFVVQGTAAEWALCWMGALRRMLWQLGGADGDPRPLAERPHLVFFLHDELIVHTPAELAERVADALRGSAAEAGRILFGAAPVEFPLSVAVVDSYADAK
ncbi:bifunctional 3'-5' exonuclease/DNA polymerase [Protaetiibacter intestinalis]|uniref:DNA-directed DNA polymerase n=1 Tax=Protaetiibacter intestinalis TaxID=2419774 RepID=A0A387BKC0_9MICO|nr:bifunctional 3'-5' exonuclease/DNA polymerase [Protaetiibacter intestinalis]AYF98960.1 bifunctional 3'-5' exonuclease/DNA polymerase [Protaetiibacter intestinalis]